MTKRVEMSRTAYEWFLRHPFVSEETLIGVVLYTPVCQRQYIDDIRFTVSFRKKRDGGFVKITLWVEERETIFFMGKIHSKRL